MATGPAPHIGTERRRQMLAQRQLLGADGRSGRTVHDVVGLLGMLHSTDPSTPYLSIHARSDAVVGDIDAALYERPRRILRHTTMRRTVFVMADDVVPLAHGASNPPLVHKLRTQLVKWLETSPDIDEPAAEFLARTEDRVLGHLGAAGPSTGIGLSTAVGELRVSIDPMPRASYSRPIRITSKVLEVLAAEGRIARGRPVGDDFTSGAWTWAPSDEWWPQGVGRLPPTEALAGLLDRYLAVFGPATVTDMAWWTGLTKTAVRVALARNGAVEVVLDQSETGWVRRGDVDELAGGVSEHESVALLPGLDTTTMGWKQRGWYVDDSHEAGLFDRNGNAGPTVWVDGRVVGAWTQRPDGEIVVELPDQLGRASTDRVEAEADRLARWLGDVRIKWRYPTPVTKRLAGE